MHTRGNDSNYFFLTQRHGGHGGYAYQGERLDHFFFSHRDTEDTEATHTRGGTTLSIVFFSHRGHGGYAYQGERLQYFFSHTESRRTQRLRIPGGTTPIFFLTQRHGGSAFIILQVPRAMETMRSQPRRGVTVVASHAATP